jgi:hypothetical protein
MFKLKGKYDWKLINADTGEIDQEGTQWNTISDVLIEWVFKSGYSNQYGTASSVYGNQMAILLSDSITGSDDYRRYGKSNRFNILATGAAVGGGGNVDWNALSKYCDNNFAPPGAPRTVNIIGIKIFEYNNNEIAVPNFVSFIQLSTPITQNTNQYLYVKYTVFFLLDVSIGYNTPNNRSVEYALRQGILTYMVRFGNKDQSDCFILTPFLPPEDINNVARYCNYLYKVTASDFTLYTEYYNYGHRLSRAILKNFAVADIVGPIGATVFGRNIIITSPLNRNMSTIYGYSQNKSMVPSIARVFVHPGTRDAYLFSDPSYPASSQGTVTVSGTPTNKYPVIARIRITKTGDATGLVAEVVLYTAVNTSTSQITITQDFTTGDIYKVTTTGTLPSPLVLLTNYYIIRIDSTHIRLATSYANALAGTYITLTTQGSGNHTFTRQNTGEYSLELEPWNYTTVSPYSTLLNNLSMAVDVDGYVMPLVLNSTTEYAEGDYVSNSTSAIGNELYYYTVLQSASMLRGTAKNGNYIYSIQQSRKGLINNICRWAFNTIETSQALCKFGNGSTKVVSSVYTALKMYIATNDGIYEYTFSTPTVAPVLLTITGMISSAIKDMCMDPITGYLWTGHATGLSRIDIGTLTATQYISGTGQALEGMTATYYDIGAGQLDAYNGRVLKGGDAYGQVDNNAWVLDDGIGWYRIALTCYSCALVSGTSNIIFSTNIATFIYAVTVTGKGTGSYTQVETFSKSVSLSHTLCQYVQLSSTKFFMIYLEASSAYQISMEVYNIGVGISSLKGQNTNTSLGYLSNYFSWALGALRRNKIDVDGNANSIFIWNSMLFVPNFPTPISYGWDGSAWVKSVNTSREIPKTVTHTLVNGLSVDFNNATGSSWDTQFVLNESFNIVHGPYQIKDNLQTLQWKAKQFFCKAIVVTGYSASISGSIPYNITIPEVSDPNFRDIDTADFTTEVYEGTTPYTQYAPTQRTASITPSTDLVAIAANVPTGTPVTLYSTSNTIYAGSLYYPLEEGKTYYAINYNTTTIRLATTYANAIAGTYIDIGTTGLSGSNFYLYAITPTAGTYFSTNSGDFFFNSADAGKSMTLTYTYTQFTA